jgi:hypothetical protein
MNAQVPIRDAVLFCQNQISAKIALYGYDVDTMVPNRVGTSFNLGLTSPEVGRRPMRLDVSAGDLMETYLEGELAFAITRDIRDAFRHFRG